MTLRASILPQRVRRRRARPGSGQALVEFAVLVPILLVILAGAADLGRLFFAQVAMDNAAREGAVFGSSTPNCDVVGTACTTTNTVQYRVDAETQGLTGVTMAASCIKSNGAAVVVSACAENDTYRVDLGYTFRFATPILTPIFGSTMAMSSRSDAIVFNNAFDPSATASTLPVVTATPVPTPTPTAAPTPTPAPGATPTPTPAPTPTPSPTPSPTPVPTCAVPSFLGVRVNDADLTWRNPSFTGPITYQPGNGNYPIQYQSLTANSVVPCTSSITVGP